jgi:hypothetical protein
MKATVTFTLSFPIDVKKEKRYYLASCPLLDVWAYSETQQGAVHNLKETLQLKSCGFTTLKRALCQNSSHPMDEITVPLPFIIDQSLAN